jgi:hypothetical protein
VPERGWKRLFDEPIPLRPAGSDRAIFEIERAEEEPAFTKLVYLEGSL